MKNRVFITVTLLLSLALFLIGWFMFSGNDDVRLWHAFLINFLFFTSAAGGLVVWPAIVISSYGKWMGDAEQLCRAGFSFSLPSVVALIVLWAGSSSWAPWIADDKGGMLWLNNTFLFSRNLVALIAFWIMAFLFVRKRNTPQSRTWAGWLIITYVITFSLMGFDFVMALEPHWYSMMMGGYFFITGVYIAVAIWALMAVVSGTGSYEVRHDLGNLIIAFCIFSFYLMFSQLFPIWYENNPLETLFLVPRMNYSWKWISYLLLLLVYLGPIIFLLPARLKRNPVSLGIISSVIIIGMWIERWWLVSAVFNKQNVLFGWMELISLLAFLALFIAGIFLSNILKSPKVQQEKLPQ